MIGVGSSLPIEGKLNYFLSPIMLTINDQEELQGWSFIFTEYS